MNPRVSPYEPSVLPLSSRQVQLIYYLSLVIKASEMREVISLNGMSNAPGIKFMEEARGLTHAIQLVRLAARSPMLVGSCTVLNTVFR